MLPLFFATAHAAALVGAAWVPPGASVLAWDDAGEWSGTLVGEFDGLLRPPLTAEAGWVGQRDAVLGGLAFAWVADERYAASTARQGVWALRLSGDYRRYLRGREAGQVNGYGTAGLYGVIPGAIDQDDSYTEAEAAGAQEGADALMARVGGVGAQAGIGAEYLFGDTLGRPAVAVGVRWVGRLHRAQSVTDDGYTVSVLAATEVALVVAFQL